MMIITTITVLSACDPQPQTSQEMNQENNDHKSPKVNQLAMSKQKFRYCQNKNSSTTVYSCMANVFACGIVEYT